MGRAPVTDRPSYTPPLCNFDEVLRNALQNGRVDANMVHLPSNVVYNSILHDDPQSLKTLIDIGRAEVICSPSEMSVDSSQSSPLPLKQKPIHLTAFYGRYECMKLLIEAGHDVNARDEMNNTPAVICARHGFSDCLRLLISAGCDVNLAGVFLDTPLHVAALEGEDECVQLLLEAGCLVSPQNADLMQAIHVACFRNHLSTVKLLLSVDRALLHSVCGHNKTPLEHAIENDSAEVAHYLLSLDAKVDAKWEKRLQMLLETGGRSEMSESPFHGFPPCFERLYKQQFGETYHESRCNSLTRT